MIHITQSKYMSLIVCRTIADGKETKQQVQRILCGPFATVRVLNVLVVEYAYSFQSCLRKVRLGRNLEGRGARETPVHLVELAVGGCTLSRRGYAKVEPGPQDVLRRTWQRLSLGKTGTDRVWERDHVPFSRPR
ncbi:hypothetical protein TNCV_350601 [Trichonephila clavipes]|nr:hypothetical protein TNCV_350601 [Trichonephila clavipes]